MIAAKLSVAHLAQCSRVAAEIARLPAVATPDWCEIAGRTLLQVCPDCTVSVTIVEPPQSRNSDRAMRILATGAASDHHSLASHRVHPDSANDLGWTLADSAHPGPASRHPRVSRLRELPSWSRWPVTPAGKRWAKLSIRELLCADVALPDCPDEREILVEVGSSSAMQRFDRAEPEMLSALLPILSSRASLAYGQNFTQPLTTREQLILVELVSGASVREIAERIGRSPHTVHDHVKSLHRKLNASSRGELVSRYLGFESDGPAASVTPHIDDHHPEITTRRARPTAPSTARS
jgi:DNA-binding CsgD family transcriptional regulator